MTAHARLTNRFKLWISALGLALMFVGSSAHAAAPTTTDEPTSETASTTASDGARRTSVAPLGDRARSYAQREAATPRAGDFKGNGAGIYIGGSTLAVALVVVLVVVLL